MSIEPDGVRSELGEAIEAGLAEAVAWRRGQLPLETIEIEPMPPERIRAIVRTAARSAKDFEKRFAIPAGTINNWLQGRRSPDPAARAYLTVIAHDPVVVERALRATGRR